MNKATYVFADLVTAIGKDTTW
jgi:hypothetical protein